MFARTYKYTVADPAKYCDHEGCKTSHALVKCVWSGHKNPGDLPTFREMKPSCDLARPSEMRDPVIWRDPLKCETL